MALLAAKLAAVITGAEFQLSTLFYFRRRTKAQATWVMGAFLIVAIILYAVFLVLAQDTPLPQVTVALILFVISNVLFWSALVSHGARRPSAVLGETVPEALATSGPYRLVRHPFYLSYVLAFLGAALVGNQWFLYVVTLGLFLCYDWAARKEEHLLASVPGLLGKQYADYRRRTWRWVPFVW